MADQLKACPFCNGINIADTSNGIESCMMQCDDCGAEGPTATNYVKSVAAWNTRSEQVGVPTVQAGDVRNATLEFAAENFEALVISRDEIFKAGYVIDTLRFLKSAAPSQPVAGKPNDEQIFNLIVAVTNIAACFGAGQIDKDKAISDTRALLTTANAGKDAK